MKIKIVLTIMLMVSCRSLASDEAPGGPPTNDQHIGYWKLIEWPNPDVQKINPWPLPFQWFAFYEDGRVLSMMKSEDSAFSYGDLELIFSTLPTQSPKYKLQGQFLTVENPGLKGYLEIWWVTFLQEISGQRKRVIWL